MRIAVIGAGIVGVTTAYELAADGHEVAVFERNGSVAAGASFANAGIVAPGGVLPWDAGGKRRGAFWQLLGADPSLRLASRADLGSLIWARRRQRAHGAWSESAAQTALHRLAGFSQQRLHEITRLLRLDYERADGLLVLLRTPDDLERAQPMLARLAGTAIKHRVLDSAGCRAAEPDLNDETPPHAGIYFEDGEVGNCRQFANLLRAAAQRLGARFRYQIGRAHV